MATIQALGSVQVEDYTHEVGSFDQPFKFDPAVASLANLQSWIQGLGIQVDTVSDGLITKLRISLLLPLPSGLKSTAGANKLEETGLITYTAVGTANRFGQDVPAMSAADFTGSQIILSGSPSVAGLTAYSLGANFNCTPTDRYGNALAAVSRARMTFRKHRRALERA
jgi:hypothetical protein